VRFRDATTSYFVAKFGAQSSHILAQSPQNVTVVCGIDCLACQDEFFMNNPFNAQMMSMLLTLLFTSLAFFGFGEFGLSVYGSCFLP
jgi:hypothetical protein